MNNANSRLSIGLVQINNSFSNQNYFPYSVGILQAYAQKHLKDKESFVFGLPIYKRLPVKNAVEHLKGSDIVLFSTYTWNINLSLEIARKLKALDKKALIVFGGPQVPSKGIREFLKKNKFIDIACHGEGEKAVLLILENAKSGKWSGIPNIAFRGKNGKISVNHLGERTEDLDSIPSPYTKDVFKELIQSRPEENWIGLFETNRGCPFSCSYCVWGAYENKKVYARDLDALCREIDWFSANKVEFIFCCDANFGILPRDQQIVEYMSANKAKLGYPKALSCQNTKNSTMRIYNIYKALSDSKLSKGVSLSIQSSNPSTLKSIKRENISLDTFQELQEKFNTENIETFTDLILGLPCETYSSFADGVSAVIGNGQHNRIQFNNLSILTSSEMDDKTYLRKYGIKTVKNRLINVHGSLSETNEVDEFQNLVIATKAMPAKDWRKVRVFGWMTSLLHFDKLAQIPFILINKKLGLSYREIIEKIIQHSPEYPVLKETVSFFENQAKLIQKGKPEFYESAKWLNIWWPPDEYMMINICSGNKLDALYSELEELIKTYMVGGGSGTVIAEALNSALLLNKNLIKLPNRSGSLALELPYDIWSFYRAALGNKEFDLKKGRYTCSIDRTAFKWNSWEDWCREVIWYGNKRGAYIYPCVAMGR